MEVIERREDGALVQLTAELGDATFYVTDEHGTRHVVLSHEQSVTVLVPYGGTISVNYGVGNSDTLFVGAATVDAIKKATSRRFPGMKVGL